MAEDTVQAYLTKHKVSSLFEELMSKIVKELPSDPIDFLIKKLQILHRQKKKDSPHVSSIGSSKASRGRIEVTGTSVTTKTPTSVKSPISDRLSKSTSGLRPIKSKPALSSSSALSLSKTTPTRPHTTSRPVVGGSGTKTSSSKIPTASTIKTKPDSKPASRIPSATSKRTPTTRPSTAPVGNGKPSSSTPSTGKTRTATKAAATKASSIPGAGRTPVGKGFTPSKLASSSSSSVKSVTKKEVEISIPVTVQNREAKVEEIAEFFGEPKKSSQRQFFVDSDEEGSGDVGGVESEDASDSEGVAHLATDSKRDSGINIQDIVTKRRCKHAKRSRGANRRLPVALSNSSTPLSLGYDDDETESGDSDVGGGVELLEDPDALRDEGVEVTRSNYTITKSLAVPETQEVVLCARCAKALGKSETCAATGTDFESVSQVSYPQCGSEDMDSSLSEQGPAVSERDLETSSDVTLESHDTWGGLAPAAPQVPLSEEESEIQLPPPPPLQGHTWMPETAPHDVHGWGQHDN